MNETHQRGLRDLAAFVATVLLVLACGCEEAGKKTLLFHAGAGQRSSLDEVDHLFQQRYPEVAVNFAYKGSGYFLADITRSQEGDLYMPGEEFYFLQAVERRFIRDYDPKRDIAAHFVTVIITPRGNPQGIQKLEDLARPGVRVGLGNPQACAIGLWHEKTFKRAGLWDAVQNNATMSAKCIPELGNAAQHKLIDATIVWATTAVLYLRDVEIIPLEPRYRGIIRLPVGVLTFAKHPKEAQLLKDLILSEDGKAILISHAYAVGDLPRDDEGFEADDGRATDPLMTWLVNAAVAVKDESYQADAQTVGPLLREVVRQRKTLRAGN
jgi:molybdate transport system substrate-binding protein